MHHFCGSQPYIYISFFYNYAIFQLAGRKDLVLEAELMKSFDHIAGVTLLKVILNVSFTIF